MYALSIADVKGKGMMYGPARWIRSSQRIKLVAGLKLCDEEGGSLSWPLIGVIINTFAIGIIWQHQ